MAPCRTLFVGPSHAAVVAELHEATIGGGWGVDSVSRLLDLPGAGAVLATIGTGAHTGAGSDAAPCGFALVLPAGDAIDLAAMGVLPHARRRGCGRALIAGVLNHAVRYGADKCLLEVAADNDVAKALYIACGFEQYGTRPRYYRRSATLCVDAHLFMHRLGDEETNP